MTDPTALIEVSGISKSFAVGDGFIDVLCDLHLTIAKGERVAIVGASGAGKTTLMHILGGLDSPTSGSVHFAGRELFRLSSDERDLFRNRTIGFVFQFHQLLPEFTAMENVMMPALIARLPRHDAEQRAIALLEEVGLGQRLHHKPGALSGGEQQRVAIARALVMQPQLLLADEPTGNLDSGTSREILRLLERLHRDRNLTMIIVTHSDLLAGSMDRIVRMADGRFVD